MKIAVLYKWAYDPQFASVNENGIVDWGNKLSISEYDPVAFQVASTFAKTVDAQIIGVTAGIANAGSPKAVQSAAARGVDELVVIADDALTTASPDIIAQILSMELANLEVDLVLTGEASADSGAQVIPGLVAGYMGIPSIAGVTSLRWENNALIVEREMPEALQTLRINGKAVLSLTSDATSVPLIGMKDMLAARKKPVTVKTLADLSPVSSASGNGEVLSTYKPVVKPRKNILFDSDNAVQELVAALEAEGVI